MTKNLPASVRQRLTNKAREADRPFQEVLQYFAMERFLYRLTRSPHADKFVLKGALLFTAWGGPSSRPTKDIDFLARMDNAVESVVAVMRDVCGQEVEPDGLVFDAGSVAGEAIKEDADYSGVRVTFRVTLQNARVAMQIDLGFGDVVTPAAAMTGYPALLDFPAPRLLGYPRETVVAEKFEAMTALGLLAEGSDRSAEYRAYFDKCVVEAATDRCVMLGCHRGQSAIGMSKSGGLFTNFLVNGAKSWSSVRRGASQRTLTCWQAIGNASAAMGVSGHDQTPHLLPISREADLPFAIWLPR